tara:strand:+ start:17719 stop:18060 length:342 start_codon:yes stop_codon:yes gene_type:complete
MKLTKEEIMNDVDHDKVTLAFGLFVIGRQSEDKITSYLQEFRHMFFDVIRKKSKESQPDTNDDVMKQHNDIDIERDIQTVGSRSIMDLEQDMLELGTDKDSWKKVFEEKLKWV